MARKPEDTKPRHEASEVKREAEADIDATSRAGKSAPAHEKVHPKVHKSQDEGPIQDTTGQPVVEDEP